MKIKEETFIINTHSNVSDNNYHKVSVKNDTEVVQTASKYGVVFYEDAPPYMGGL